MSDAPLAVDPHADPPLPPRIAWFAPWRWFPRLRPWQRGLLYAGVLLAGYVLSPMPVVYTLRRMGAFNTPMVLRPFEILYAPLEWGYNHSPVVQAFYDQQREWLEAGFGPIP